jgi:hypothetical protein
MKTTISVAKLQQMTMEIEFPICYKAKDLNIFHYFKDAESLSFQVYNMPGDHLCHNKALPIDYILSSDTYEPCPLDIFFENYAEARYANDVILDFQQNYLILSDHE